jgi:hypothetical protein
LRERRLGLNTRAFLIQQFNTGLEAEFKNSSQPLRKEPKMKSTAIAQGRRAANAIANTTNVQLFPDYSVATLPALLTMGASGILDGKKFSVCASGECTTINNSNVKLGLYGKVATPANPLLAASWTKLAESTARNVNTTSAPWWIEAEFITGQISQKLQGAFTAFINSLYDVPAILTNPVAAGLLPAGSVEPCFQFCVGIDFSIAGLNIGVLKYFALEC